MATGSAADLQTKLNGANPGDVIIVPAGAVYTGNFTLPAKSNPSNKWIYVISDKVPVAEGGAGGLPAAAQAPDQYPYTSGQKRTRVRPSSDAVNMPKLTDGTGSTNAVIVLVANVNPPTNFWRLVGLEIATDMIGTGTEHFRLIDTNADSTTIAGIPHHLVFDRCYIHGVDGATAALSTRLQGAIDGNVNNSGLIDSDVRGVHEPSVGATGDTQTWICTNGSYAGAVCAPTKIVNNRLEAAGENIMFGGADPAITNLVPSDIEVRRNYFFKNPAWGQGSNSTQTYAVKNSFEFKNAARVLVSENVFENSWAGSDEHGDTILLNARNQNNTAPWSTVVDINFGYNIMAHVANCFEIAGHDSPNTSGPTDRLNIQHNLLVDVGKYYTTAGGSGPFNGRIIGAAAADGQTVRFTHNTCIVAPQYDNGVSGSASGWGCFGRWIAQGLVQIITFTNNIFSDCPSGAVGVGGDGSDHNMLVTRSTYWNATSTFNGNVIVGGGTTAALGNYATQTFPTVPAATPGFVSQWTPSVDPVGFVKWDGGLNTAPINGSGSDYRLAASSIFKGQAADGTDPGADMTTVYAVTANCISGTWGS